MNTLLHWATGSGKTKAALDLIGSIAPKSPEILIVVGETQNKQEWKNEMKKWSWVLEDYCNIICYASLKKMHDTKWDVLVLDECHHSATVKRINSLKRIKADNVIALSATPGNSIDTLQEVYGAFSISKQGLNELIDKGRLPKPEIFIYGLTLNNEPGAWGGPSELTQYKAVNNRVKADQVRYAKTRNDGDKFRMLQTGLERKRLLGQFKLPYVDYLLDKIDDKRYICFCPTIETARKLYELHPMGSACVDSKFPKNHNEEMITAFNEGNKDHLFVVGMLNEGTNLVDVDAGVLIQMDKQERTTVQRLGRVLRSEHPKMYFFKFHDTIDDTLVENITNNIDSSNVINYEFSRKLLKNHVKKDLYDN